MKKLIPSLLLTTLVSVPAVAMAEDSPHSITGNVGLFSDYSFRGVSQTVAEPALQGGFDYAHASGFYLGTWASNISESIYVSGADTSNMEWDFYGGYSGSVGDVGYNVGLLKYYYPGATVFDTLELYGAISYKWLSLKASYNLDDYFGVANSDGTVYWDLGFSYDLPAGFKLGAHYGWTAGEGAQGDYEDWKLGVSKDVSGFTLGLAYTDTDLPAAVIKGEDINEGRWILSVSKSF